MDAERKSSQRCCKLMKGCSGLMLLSFGIWLCITKEIDGADSVDEAPKMVFTKPLHVEDNKLTYFEMVEPASLRYIYRARPARDFGVDFNQSYSSVELFVGEPVDGCSRVLNAGEVRGNSVLFIRGKCSFVSKAINAAEAGAQFVIISDDDPGSTNTRIDMVHDETDRKVYIPAMFIAGKDGAMIRRELEKNTPENFAIINIPMNLTAVPYHKRRHPPWTLI